MIMTIVVNNESVHQAPIKYLFFLGERRLGVGERVLWSLPSKGDGAMLL